MKFVAYLSSCPPGPKNAHKHEIIKNFYNGVRAVGDEAILTENPIADPTADVGFIQGWINNNPSANRYTLLRQQVIQTQQRNKRRVLVADSNMFNYVDGNKKKDYIRYSFDNVFPTNGVYFWDNPDPKRWEQIQRDTGARLKPWRQNGRHILICTQRNGGWSMAGVDVPTWLENTVNEIRKYSDRPIVVRGHPGDRHHREYIDRRKYSLSSNPLITQDLNNAWAVVTYNSSPGVAAAIEGIPVFVTDPNPQISQAYPVANTNLADIENPKTFERFEWVNKIAMSHWRTEEIKDGSAWRHMRVYV